METGGAPISRYRTSLTLPRMGPISQQTIDLVDKVPGFRDDVDRAATLQRARPVRVALSLVEDDPWSLYAMLEYARHRGVQVTFLPDIAE